MRNAGLDQVQAGIKTIRRNINNLRYADNTILMAESKEELNNLLMRVKEKSEKAGFKAQHSLVYISVFVSVPYCLDDYSFVVYSQVRKVDSSSPILSQDCFSYSGSFVFPYEL